MKATATDFRDIGFWAPRSFGYWLCRPRLWPAISHRPVAVRFAEDEQWPYETPNVVRWTYDPSVHGKRLCLEFANRPIADLWRFRWRTLANSLWKIVDTSPQITFHEVPVDVSDCADPNLPRDVFRFAKMPEDPHDLLPNPYLLEPERSTFKPLAWSRKADSVFFRGGATGPRAYEANARVAACLAAQKIDGGDCKLTAFSDAGKDFKARSIKDGIVAAPTKPMEMSRHRYLLEIDGHTSSWDRFRRIGLCGGVPIRFETRWQEYWHDQIVERTHYDAATRSNIEAVVADLRESPGRAQDIASHASEFVRDVLSADKVQESLQRIWLERISGASTAGMRG
jgi:hypothetical protein